MAGVKKSNSKINVRCFCGNSIAVSKNFRKEVVCVKCHQALPMQAIRIAFHAREQEAMDARAWAPGIVPSTTM